MYQLKKKSTKSLHTTGCATGPSCPAISISKNDKTVPVQTIDTLFKLKPNQTSGIINLGYGLEIVKNLGEQNGKIKAAHVFINFQPIDKLLTPYRDKQPPITYIKV